MTPAQLDGLVQGGLEQAQPAKATVADARALARMQIGGKV